MGQPWYMNSSGLVQFAGTQVIPKSIQLDGLIAVNPYRVVSGQDSVSALALSRSIMTVNDKKVFLFAPSATNRSNRQCYVWDFRLNGWVTLDALGDITSAVSLSTTNDRELFYSGDTTGQIYQMTNFYDSAYTYKPSSVAGNTLVFTGTINTTGLANTNPVLITVAGNGFSANAIYYVVNRTDTSISLSNTPTGTPLTPSGGSMVQFREVVPISWNITTRAYGQAYADGIGYYAKNRPYQLDIHMEAQDFNSTIFNWSLISPTNQSQTGNTYTIQGNTVRAIRGVRRDLSDFNWQVELNGSDALNAFRIYAVHLHMIESGITRHR